MVRNTLNRRQMLMSLAAGIIPSSRPARDQQRPPNLLYILADDLGFGDPTCYNRDSKTPTPALDYLAQRGLRFM